MLRFRALLRSPHAKAPLLRAAAARMSTQPPTTPHPYESFLSGTSANYVDDMYESWQQDPAPQRRHTWPRSQLPTSGLRAPPASPLRCVFTAPTLAPQASVHSSWQSVFRNMDAGLAPGRTFTPPPTIAAGQSLVAAAVPAGDVDQATP